MVETSLNTPDHAQPTLLIRLKKLEEPAANYLAQLSVPIKPVAYPWILHLLQTSLYRSTQLPIVHLSSVCTTPV